jgi:hypothetical protein
MPTPTTGESIITWSWVMVKKGLMLSQNLNLWTHDE